MLQQGRALEVDGVGMNEPGVQRTEVTVIQKKRLEMIEELNSTLEGEGSIEEKRAAITEFRTTQAQWREELEPLHAKRVPMMERAEEKAKAAGLERMQAQMAKMPEGPHKALVEAQADFAEALVAFEEKAQKMTPEERREELRLLATSRRKALENVRQGREVELAGRGTVGEKRAPANPFQQSLEAEQAKLQAVLEGEANNQDSREAVARFREAVGELREEHRRQTEDLREQKMPARELPGTRSRPEAKRF